MGEDEDVKESESVLGATGGEGSAGGSGPPAPEPGAADSAEASADGPVTELSAEEAQAAALTLVQDLEAEVIRLQAENKALAAECDRLERKVAALEGAKAAAYQRDRLIRMARDGDEKAWRKAYREREKEFLPEFPTENALVKYLAQVKARQG